MNLSKIAAKHQKSGMTLRVPVSILVTFDFLTAVILWLFFYTHLFGLLQNEIVIALIVSTFLAVMGVTWGVGKDFPRDRTSKGEKNEIR